MLNGRSHFYLRFFNPTSLCYWSEWEGIPFGALGSSRILRSWSNTVLEVQLSVSQYLKVIFDISGLLQKTETDHDKSEGCGASPNKSTPPKRQLDRTPTNRRRKSQTRTIMNSA
ncbi:uncharacterized protein LOC122078629 [Macadamia integrifolia]|uniref:uncharacterized protein LOC122078629 n=1 Tax=Macadamia integrifolia TaxID=60698 RepID=UPI001C4EF2D6|nr:uncharacterized protein LOC122078629 [Macadamia integrifolia]